MFGTSGTFSFRPSGHSFSARSKQQNKNLPHRLVRSSKWHRAHIESIKVRRERAVDARSSLSLALSISVRETRLLFYHKHSMNIVCLPLRDSFEPSKAMPLKQFSVFLFSLSVVPLTNVPTAVPKTQPVPPVYICVWVQERVRVCVLNTLQFGTFFLAIFLLNRLFPVGVSVRSQRGREVWGCKNKRKTSVLTTNHKHTQQTFRSITNAHFLLLAHVQYRIFSIESYKE